MSKISNFSIATLNTHGVVLLSSPQETKRFEALCQIFELLPLDLINLQEVWSYMWLSLLKKKLRSYPYVVYEHGLLGPKAGLVTFSRTPLSSTQFINIPPTAEPKKKRFMNRLKRNMKKKGTLVSFMTEFSFIFCNTYLVANGDGDWSRENRYYRAHEHDITQLAEIVNNLVHWEKDILISGDFNVPKCSSLYLQFVDLSLAKDVFEKNETSTFHHELLPPGKQPHCIDYMFIRSPSKHGQIQIKKTILLFREKCQLSFGEMYLSDHLGLMAELLIHSD